MPLESPLAEAGPLELVRSRRWSARDLAQEAGIDEKTARNLITGRATRIDLETIAKVASALGVGPGSLWNESPSFAERGRRVAGSTGPPQPGEIEDVLSGRWDVDTDPGLQRATRDV